MDDRGQAVEGEASEDQRGSRVAAAAGMFWRIGEWDTSGHDWLEGRGPRLYLVAMIDDATSQAYARFARHDSTEENLRLLWGYVERWGGRWSFTPTRAACLR